MDERRGSKTDKPTDAGRSETSNPGTEAPPQLDPPRPRGNAAKRIQRQLEDLLAGATIGLATIDPRRAAVLNESAEDLARVWSRLADENPAVRRYLEAMLSGSAWGEALLVTSVVAIRMLPESFELPAVPGFFGESGGGGESPPVPPSPEVKLQQEADAVAEQRRQEQERARAARESAGGSAAPQSAPKAEADGSGDDSPPA